MPPEILDYQSPRKQTKPYKRHVPMNESLWFKCTSQAFVLSLIALPIAGVSSSILGHSFGMIGAIIFIISEMILLQSFRRVAPWRLLIIPAIVAIVITIVLHFVSISTFIIENASGQTIRKIRYSPLHGNYSFGFQNIPKDVVFQFKQHDLTYDGIGSVDAQLADGTFVYSLPPQIKGTRYNGVTKIVIPPSGDVTVSWP